MSAARAKVLITAGPTREYWDPVRFLSNGSSGQMGIALAEVAARSGAKVTLVIGPATAQCAMRNAKVVRVVSARDMERAVRKHLKGTDIFIGAAAVSDFRPAVVAGHKLKGKPEKAFLTLVRNPDIIAGVAQRNSHRPRTVVGFALETRQHVQYAKEKLSDKNLDWIVSNDQANLGSAKGRVTLLSRWGDSKSFKRMPKTKLAEKIWQTILSR